MASTTAAICVLAERRELQLLELREAREREALRERRLGPVGEDEQHGRRVDGARDHVEQVARERVEPVAVLEHEHERLASAALARRQSASRFSSEVLRSFASNELVSSVSGIGRPSSASSSGARGNEGGVDRARAPPRAPRSARRRGRARGRRAGCARSRARRSSSRSSRTTGTRRTATSTPRRRTLAHELGDQARLAHPGLGRDADDPALARSADASRPRVQRRRARPTDRRAAAR